MNLTKQNLIMDTHTIKEEGIQTWHQTTRQDKKEEKWEKKKNYKTNSQSVNKRYLSIITFNVNELNVPIKTMEWLNR